MRRGPRQHQDRIRLGRERGIELATVDLPTAIILFHRTGLGAQRVSAAIRFGDPECKGKIPDRHLRQPRVLLRRRTVFRDRACPHEKAHEVRRHRRKPPCDLLDQNGGIGHIGTRPAMAFGYGQPMPAKIGDRTQDLVGNLARPVCRANACFRQFPRIISWPGSCEKSRTVCISDVASSRVILHSMSQVLWARRLRSSPRRAGTWLRRAAS